MIDPHQRFSMLIIIQASDPLKKWMSSKGKQHYVLRYKALHEQVCLTAIDCRFQR